MLHLIGTEGNVFQNCILDYVWGTAFIPAVQFGTPAVLGYGMERTRVPNPIMTHFKKLI